MYRDGPASHDGQIEPQMVRVDRRRLGAPDREHGIASTGSGGSERGSREDRDRQQRRHRCNPPERFIHVNLGTKSVGPGRFATFSRTQRSGPMRVSGIGEHAVEVLTSAGLSRDRIATLAESGAITIGAPVEQKLMPSYR